MTFHRILSKLAAADYLAAQFAAPKETILHITLLANGQQYAKHLQQQWQESHISNVPQVFHRHDNGNDTNKHLSVNNPLAYINSAEFARSCEFLQAQQLGFPVASKQLLHFDPLQLADMPQDDKILQFVPANGTCLVTDYFLQPSIGREHFYNIQRARKIWWMRFAANPSRFTLTPYPLTAGHSGDFATPPPPTCQSVTIEAHFPWGSALLEQLTLIPLADTPHNNEVLHFRIRVPNSDPIKTLPAVIRSVVYLEAAACVMFLDAIDCKRDALLLNAKLAPYQVKLCCGEYAASADLRDLCDHITYVLRANDLRVLANPSAIDASHADHIGVPYAIIIDAESLKTGLLQLRSRDTTLIEYVHISDLTHYLLNIFMLR